MAEDKTSLPQIGTPNYTRYSEGSIPDNSSASLIKDFGEVFNAAVRAGDEEIKRYLRDSVSKEVDAARDDSIKSIAIDTERLIGMGGDNIPQDLNNSLDRASRMAKAKSLRSTSDTHYYAQLDAIVRNVRSRFPAYRDYIDDYVSKLTGTVPANALRRALLSQQAVAAQGGKDINETFVNTLKDAAKQGADISKWLPYMKTGISKEILQEARIDLLGQTANIHQLDVRQKVFNNRLTANKVNREESEMQMKEEFTKVGTNFIAKNGETLQKFANMTQPEFLNWVNANPEESRRILTALPQMEAQLRSQLLQTSTKYQKFIDKKDIDASIELQVGHLSNIRQALTDKDFGSMNFTANMLKITKNNAELSVLGSDVMKRIYGIKAVGGENLMQHFIVKNPQIIKDALKLAVYDSTAKFMEGSSTLAKETENINSNPKFTPTEKSNAIGELLNKNKEIVLKLDYSNPLNRPLFDRAFVSLFGKDSDLIARVRNGQIKKEELFSFLTSQDMTNRMQQIKNMGGENIFQAYTGWVERSWMEVNRNIIQDAKNMKFRSEVSLEFKNGRFEYRSIPSTVGTSTNPSSAFIRGINTPFEKLLQAGAETSVDQLNRSLIGLKNLGVLDDNKMATLIERTGILDQAKQDAPLESFAKAVDKWYTGIVEKSKKLQDKVTSNPLGPLPPSIREQRDKKVNSTVEDLNKSRPGASEGAEHYVKDGNDTLRFEYTKGKWTYQGLVEEESSGIKKKVLTVDDTTRALEKILEGEGKVTDKQLEDLIKFDIAYGNRNEKLIKELPNWKTDLSSINRSNKEVLYLSTLAANKSATVALGFDLSKVKSTFSNFEGSYIPRTDEINVTGFGSRQDVENTIVHESTHRAIEILKKRKTIDEGTGYSVKDIINNIRDETKNFIGRVDPTARTDFYKKGIFYFDKNEQRFSGYMSDDESVARLISSITLGGSSESLVDGKGSTIYPDREMMTEFLSSEEGKKVLYYYDILERMSAQELKKTFKGEGELPLPKI